MTTRELASATEKMTLPVIKTAGYWARIRGSVWCLFLEVVVAERSVLLCAKF